MLINNCDEHSYRLPELGICPTPRKSTDATEKSFSFNEGSLDENQETASDVETVEPRMKRRKLQKKRNR